MKGESRVATVKESSILNLIVDLYDRLSNAETMADLWRQEYEDLKQSTSDTYKSKGEKTNGNS